MIACGTSFTHAQLLEFMNISILLYCILKFLFYLCTLSILITYSVHNLFLFLSPSETTFNLCLSVYFSMLNLISQSCNQMSIVAGDKSLSFPVFNSCVSAFYSFHSTFLFSILSSWIYTSHLQSTYVYVSPLSDYMYFYSQNFSPRKISQSLIYIILQLTILSLCACMYLHFTVFILLCLYCPYIQSKCVHVLPHFYSTMHVLYFPFFNLYMYCSILGLQVCISQSSVYMYLSVFTSLGCMSVYFPTFILLCMYCQLFYLCVYISQSQI